MTTTVELVQRLRVIASDELPMAWTLSRQVGMQAAVAAAADALERETRRADEAEVALRLNDAACNRMSALLQGVAIALRGPPPELMMYGFHDLPERAQDLKSRLDRTNQLALQRGIRADTLQRRLDAIESMVREQCPVTDNMPWNDRCLRDLHALILDGEKP